MHGINSMSRENALTQNMRNSILCNCTAQLELQDKVALNQRVGCLKWLGSTAV